jgi:hypothetical protein
MPILSSEPSIGELTVLLFLIIATLIPLTIWFLYNFESRGRDVRIKRERKPVKAKTY